MANIMQSGPRGLDHDRHEGRREADGSMYKSHRQTLRTSSHLAASLHRRQCSNHFPFRFMSFH